MKSLKALNRDIQGKLFYRSYKVDQDSIDLEARTVRVAFSSENPIEQWFGFEILDHSPGAARLKLLNDSAAFLVGHISANMVGVIEQAEISSDRRGRALVRFGRSAKAEEIWQDIAIDKIRKHISVGYFVHAMVLEKEVKDGLSTYRVTDWEPFEISTVPVPADHTVGVSRELKIDAQPTPESEKRAITMDENTNEATPATPASPAAPVVDVKTERNAARQAERDRIKEINFLGNKHNQRDLAAEYADSDKSVDQFRAAVLAKMPEMTRADASQDIGLTDAEAKSFSFLRAIDALSNPGDLKKQEAASFERECSTAASKLLGKPSQGIRVPTDALRRDMTAGTDSAGGYLVGTDLKAESFIDILRNKTMVAAMGAKLMPGLVGNVSIPKKSASTTGYWVAESGAPTESAITLGQVALSLKTVGAYVDLSRTLIMQSTPEAEAMAREDIAGVLGVSIDYAALHGTGADEQPTGLAATSGIGSVAGGANGLAATNAHIIALETAVAVANADIGSTGYLTNAKVRGKLKQTFANTTGGDTPLWTKGEGDGFGELNGYRAGATNQVSSGLTKGTASGVCSGIFFGDWTNLVIGMWGGLDLMVNPYALDTAGGIRVIGLQSVDVAVRNAAAFAAMLDVLTD